jgi:hypothetical protein
VFLGASGCCRCSGAVKRRDSRHVSEEPHSTSPSWYRHHNTPTKPAIQTQCSNTAGIRPAPVRTEQERALVLHVEDCVAAQRLWRWCGIIIDRLSPVIVRYQRVHPRTGNERRVWLDVLRQHEVSFRRCQVLQAIWNLRFRGFGL